jgi:hypothetical protein
MPVLKVILPPLIALMLALGGIRVFHEPITSGRSRVLRLDPEAGSPGDLVTAYGEGLDRSRVADLLLTNGERTALVNIVQQNEVSIRFRIPRMLAKGRYTLILCFGSCRQSVEQPVTLIVL